MLLFIKASSLYKGRQCHVLLALGKGDVLTKSKFAVLETKHSKYDIVAPLKVHELLVNEWMLVLY